MKNSLTKLFLLLTLVIPANNTSAQYVWDQMADFGGGIREQAFGFSIGSYGYAGTGRNPADQTDFWRYDPVSNSWSLMAPYPGSGRYGMVGFSIGNYGYAGLGWIGPGGGGNQFKDFWQYDPASNTWIQKNDFGGTARYSAVGFAIGTKGYVGLGFSPLQNDFWEYNPVTDAWTPKNNFPLVRQSAIGFGIGSMGYVGTGYNSGTTYRDFYEYNPATDTWTPKSDAPGLLRRNSVAFVINNNAFLGTGYNDTTYLTDFYKYDPVNDQWSTVASIGGVPRYAGFAFSIGNYGYSGTGAYGGIAIPVKVSDFWRFGDCSEGNVSVPENNSGGSKIYMSVSNDPLKGIILNYDLRGEKNAVFNFYDSMSRLVASVNLIPTTHTMNVALLPSKGVYFYSVTNSEKTLDSGKVVLY
ncbi:MAG TPA: hypothetical protein VI757_00905 [Bacteroidia bacterium]|nr:hypothetical protein [Bacteroidia bacterium]